jgi:hypothetical protein
MPAVRATAGGSSEQKAESLVEGLIAKENTQRIVTLGELKREYSAMAGRLRSTLSQAVQKSRNNSGYHSPVHCAVLAVAGWRVGEAENELLQIVDYEIDVQSVPVGTDLKGEELFPAASALVELRSDRGRVLNAIATADNMRKVELLTWVLMRRAESSQEAALWLGQAQKEYPNNRNIVASAAMLTRGESFLLRATVAP